MTRPVLSVLIPTKDRGEYLRYCVSACLRALDVDCEIVILDGSRDDAVSSDWALHESAARVRVIRSEPSLDVVANFELALDEAAGEFVCMIGDDDAVLPDIVDAARWCHDREVDALFSTITANYVWPDVRFKHFASRTVDGELTLGEASMTLTPVDLTAAVGEVLLKAGTEFGLLPRAYHGIVRADKLREVRVRCGRAFPGPSPDMSAAMALGVMLDRVYAVGLPIVLSGKASRSTGGWGAAKRHEGRLENISHLPVWAVRNWSLMVPRFFGGVTIWAEDVVSSLTALGEEARLLQFNSARLVAQCLVFHPRYWRLSFRVAAGCLREANGWPRLMFTLSLVFEYLIAWFERVNSLFARFRLNPTGSRTTRITGVTNVDDAVEKVMALRNGQRWSWTGLEEQLAVECQRVMDQVTPARY